MATYATIGAASVLAGYSRLSFSLAVIMLETTENVNLFLPIVFSLFISFSVGRLFNRSLYSVSLQSKNVPFLAETVPVFNRRLKAEAVMSRPVTALHKRAKISTIVEALRDTNHNGFPVVENNVKGDQRLLGLITRHTLMVILKNLHLVPDCTGNLMLGRQSSLDSEHQGDNLSSPPDKSVDDESNVFETAASDTTEAIP